MAVRFPKAKSSVDSIEFDINHPLDNFFNCNSLGHLIVGGRSGRDPGELSWPRGVAIDYNFNRIYVVEQYPPRVSIFSKSCEFINSFTTERMRQVSGIATYQNNVFVSDIEVHGVFHFKKESYIRLDNALVGMGSDDGKFSPRQLTVSDNGEVFVADRYNHRVQILDESLHFKRSIKLDSMQHPRDVKITNSEVFVLTDSSPCVIVFSHSGEILRSFITCGEGMQVTNPWFFCLDAKHNLIISDVELKTVKIFSPDARLIDCLEVGTQWFSDPGSIALTEQFETVLLDRDGPFHLQIYSL